MHAPAAQREIAVPGDMRAGRARANRSERESSAAVSPRAAADSLASTIVSLSRCVGRICLRRPGETFGFVAALAATIYVSVNALGFQDGRHPAPILPQAGVVRPTNVAASASAKPLAVRPAGEEALSDKIAVGMASDAAPRDAVRLAMRDDIGAIIRNADDTTASLTPKPDKNVMRAQRALVKLGYGPLKDDGVMGPGTKSALERFEREHRRPVRGEASGRTLRDLTALADKKV